MAKIEGGITSRPSGKLGNIIFGAARAPEGKVVTAREAVTPSNPDTPAQQSQRSKFRQALVIVQGIGPGVYQDDWNRAVNQLPGFQSLQSIMLNNIDGNDILQPPPDRPLGDLHFPDSFSLAAGSSAGDIDVTWSTEPGDNGDGSDTALYIAIEQEKPSNRKRDVRAGSLRTSRSSGSETVTLNQDATDYVVALYFESATTDGAQFSPAVFQVGTSA